MPTLTQTDKHKRIGVQLYAGEKQLTKMGSYGIYTYMVYEIEEREGGKGERERERERKRERDRQRGRERE